MSSRINSGGSSLANISAVWPFGAPLTSYPSRDRRASRVCSADKSSSTIRRSPFTPFGWILSISVLLKRFLGCGDKLFKLVNTNQFGQSPRQIGMLRVNLVDQVENLRGSPLS